MIPFQIDAPHHDGTLLSLVLRDSTCVLRFASSDGEEFQLTARGVCSLVGVRVQPGSCILSISVLDSTRIEEFRGPYPDLLNALRGASEDFAGALCVVMMSSYGVDLLVDCDSVVIEEAESGRELPRMTAQCVLARRKARRSRSAA